MHLYIVRHGQSTGNITTDDVPDGPLTDLGRRQAEETGARLSGEGITHVLSSPLIRALATAGAIAGAAGLDEVEVWPALQEHRFSLHRGHGHAALREVYGGAVFHESMAEEGWDHGGEDFAGAQARGAEAIAALCARFGPADRVVIATHGAFANYLLRALTQSPLGNRIWFAINNCGISHVWFVPEDRRPVDPYFPSEVEILCVNDTSHLSRVS